MGKKKRMVLLVLGIIILGIAIYQYPYDGKCKYPPIKE